MINKPVETLFLLLVFVSSSLAFQMKPRWILYNAAESRYSATKKEIPVDSFREVDVDLDKVLDCASHFGKFGVQEVEHFRDELHAYRVQQMVLGESGADIFQEKILEDELTFQLDLLKKNNPESYLFPEETSNLENEMLSQEDIPRLTDKSFNTNVAESKKTELWGELAEKGVLESLAICAVLGLLVITPQVI